MDAFQPTQKREHHLKDGRLQPHHKCILPLKIGRVVRGERRHRERCSAFLFFWYIEISKSICYEKPVELQSTLFLFHHIAPSHIQSRAPSRTLSLSRHNALESRPPLQGIWDIHLELYCVSPTHVHTRSNTRSNQLPSPYPECLICICETSSSALFSKKDGPRANIYIFHSVTHQPNHIWIIRDTHIVVALYASLCSIFAHFFIHRAHKHNTYSDGHPTGTQNGHCMNKTHADTPETTPSSPNIWRSNMMWFLFILLLLLLAWNFGVYTIIITHRTAAALPSQLPAVPRIPLWHSKPPKHKKTLTHSLGRRRWTSMSIRIFLLFICTCD